MTQPLSERELLESQIKTYEFYARLIDRAVGGRTAAIMPKWDEQRAQEYARLAEELRARLAALDEKAADAPATDPDEQQMVAGSVGQPGAGSSATSK
jgi:hypothetical protein